MKYQIRIFLKRAGTESLRKTLSAIGFAIYKENRWTKTVELIDNDAKTEIIDFKSKKEFIQEINDEELSVDEFYDCFINTDDDQLVKQIDEIITVNIDLVHGFSKKYATSELWRV